MFEGLGELPVGDLVAGDHAGLFEVESAHSVGDDWARFEWCDCPIKFLRERHGPVPIGLDVEVFRGGVHGYLPAVGADLVHL